jgi:hypothetical protein
MLETVAKRDATIPKDSRRFAIRRAEQTASNGANGARPQCRIASSLTRGIGVRLRQRVMPDQFSSGRALALAWRAVC